MDKHLLCFYCCFVILCKLILRLAGVYGFPRAVLFLNNFADPGSMLFDNKMKTREKLLRTPNSF